MDDCQWPSKLPVDHRVRIVFARNDRSALEQQINLLAPASSCKPMFHGSDIALLTLISNLGGSEIDATTSLFPVSVSSRIETTPAADFAGLRLLVSLARLSVVSLRLGGVFRPRILILVSRSHCSLPFRPKPANQHFRLRVLRQLMRRNITF